MALVQSVRRPATIAGSPLSAWAFALRMWAAMMVALYAAFWLQLESASSAAVTVGVLALQTRGQVYQKAVYRVLATIVGVAASFVIAGLFPASGARESRSLGALAEGEELKSNILQGCRRATLRPSRRVRGPDCPPVSAYDALRTSCARSEDYRF
jgi:hypothetical protein